MAAKSSKIGPVLKIKVFSPGHKKVSHDTSFFALLTKRNFMIAYQFS